jgi:hypothetical protein
MRFQRGQNSENVLSLSPGEIDFCASVTKHGRRTEPKNKIVYFGGEITWLQTWKLSWVRVPVKMLGLGLIIF